MKVEIPGQLRGAECRAVIREAIVLRGRLEAVFDDVESTKCGKLCLILRVGGSLGEFEAEPSDYVPVFDRGELVCEVVIRDHQWADRREDETRCILASHLREAIDKCCALLELPPEVARRARAVLDDGALNEVVDA